MENISIIVAIGGNSGTRELKKISEYRNGNYEAEIIVVTDSVSDEIKAMEEAHSENMLVICCDKECSIPNMLNLGTTYSHGEGLVFVFSGDYRENKGRIYEKNLITDFGIQFPEEINYGYERFFDYVYSLFEEDDKEPAVLDLGLKEDTDTEEIASSEDYLVDNLLAIKSYGEIAGEYKSDRLPLCEEKSYSWMLEVVKILLNAGEESLLLRYLPTVKESLLALFPDITSVPVAMSDTNSENMILFGSLRGDIPDKNTIKSISCVPVAEQCVGCTACKEICPVNAIEMTTNHKDSYVPRVSTEKCIGCGKCKKVCPAIRRNEDKIPENAIIALKPYDERYRQESMSGGAFGCMAEKFVSELHGVVYGVKLCDDMEVRYDRAETVNDIRPFKGSKYVQADPGDVFSLIEKDLSGNRRVLIGGTSCHLNGLINYLDEKGINRQNLFTVDLICHGVTVPVIYHRYLKYLEESYGSCVNNFIFRDKRNFGWASVVETVDFENGNTIHSEKYAEFLNHNLALNNPCYSCAYGYFERCTDITIGDYWGVQNKKPEWYDNGGVSLLIKRTANGEILWKLIEDSFDRILVVRDECIQPNLVGATGRPGAYRLFWEDYFKLPTRIAMKKYQADLYARFANGKLLSLLKKHINEGYDWRERFSSLGIKKVALYGNKEINTIVATRVALSGVFITAMGNYPDDITDFIKSIQDADTVIVTEAEFMTEILTDFKKSNFDLTRITPISYLTFQEATVNE